MTNLVKGNGFDGSTRVSMYLDSGNQRAIIGSVATPGSAYGVTVVGTIAYVADRYNPLSDQAMCLYFIKKSASNGRFSVLENTFQGQKHGCKNFGIPLVHNSHYSPTLHGPLPLHPVWLWFPSQILYHQQLCFPSIIDFS